jgi:hypothetical protein
VLARLPVIQPPTRVGFPTPDTSDKKFNSRLVVPIFSAATLKNIE